MQAEELLDTPGRRIYALRRKRGMTQGAVIKAMQDASPGFSVVQSYLSELENAEPTYAEDGAPIYKLPGGAIMSALADVLGTTTDYIAMRTNDPSIPVSADSDIAVVPLRDSRLRAEVEDLCRLYQQISPEYRRAVTDFIRTIATQGVRV